MLIRNQEIIGFMENPNRCIPEAAIPVIEEAVIVNKRTVTTGVTTLEKQVESRSYVVSEILQSSDVSIRRVPFGTEVDASNPPQMRNEAGITIIPVLEEILVVEKRLVLKEELHIRQRTTETISKQEITLRTESIELKYHEIPPTEII